MLLEDTVSARRGAIARPTGFTTTWGDSGSLAVDSVLRFLTVKYVAQPGSLVAGDQIMKIGQTTGWTAGAVVHACLDRVLSDNRKRLCSIWAKYFADGGDSGGPVFVYTQSSGVILVGFHFGSNDVTERSYASHVHRVAAELGGSIVFTTDITVSPPSLEGEVSGGLPEISWDSVATTNTVPPTIYRVYRSTHDAVLGWTEWQSLVATTTSPTFIDNDRFVDFLYGAQTPVMPASFVRYEVVADNHGVTAGSGHIHFRTFGAY